MKSSFFAIGTLLAAFIPSVLAQDAISVLRANNLNIFADKLEAEPFLQGIINGRDDVQLYAVPDDVYLSGDCAPPALPSGPQRRQSRVDPRMASQTAKKPPQPLSKRTDRRRPPKGKGPKKPSTPLPPSNFEELISVIDETFPGGYANLGPDQPQRFISNLAGSFGPGATTFRQVTTGGGDVVRTIGGPFKYNKGIIYVVNTCFTLPQPLSTTFTNSPIASIFAEAVTDSGRLSFFESTPGLTVLAPVDPPAGSPRPIYNPDDYTIVGLLYVTQLYPGETYTTLSGRTVSVEFDPATGARSINGVLIEKGNVPVQNGVLHFLAGDIWDDTPTE